MININSGLGQHQYNSIVKGTTGKVFMVSTTTDSNYDNLTDLFKVDTDGEVLLFTTITAALAACTAGRGDVILLSVGFTTAPTLVELDTARTKGVIIEQAGGRLGDTFYAQRAAATLPATTATAYFTVTGKVKVLDIIGTVTTVIETQANNTKLIANPTVGADVDLCAVNDISADAVGTFYSITGTLANAMVATTSGAGVSQAAPVTVAAGSIDLSCAATNTGATAWAVRYQPLEPGARVFAA